MSGLDGIDVDVIALMSCFIGVTSVCSDGVSCGMCGVGEANM
jgi:hypothetical protein